MTELTRRGALRTAGAAGVVAAGSVLGTSAPATAGRRRGDELRVLSINIWLSGTKIAGGLDVVADLVRRTRADVVTLSESGEATTAIADRLDRTSRRGERWTGVSSDDTGIVTSLPVRRTAPLKWTTKAVVDAGAREVAVYAAHLVYTHYATYLPRGYGAGVPAPGEFSQYGWDEIPSGPVTDVAAIERVNLASGRPDAVTAIVEDAREEARRGRPSVLGGDFNEPSALDWTAATKDLFDHHGVVLPWESTRRLGAAGWADAYRTRYPDPVTHPGFTWPASNPDAPVDELTWTPKADERDRIDYLFTSPHRGLRLRDVGIVGPRGSIVRDQRRAERTQDRFVASPRPWVSDHKAMLASFRVR